MPPCHGGGQGFKSPSGRHYASVAQLVEQGTENPRVVGSIPIGGTIICGCSSSGRAPPCQGGGGGFEPRNPLQKRVRKSRFSYPIFNKRIRRHSQAVRQRSAKPSSPVRFRVAPPNVLVLKDARAKSPDTIKVSGLFVIKNLLQRERYHPLYRGLARIGLMSSLFGRRMGRNAINWLLDLFGGISCHIECCMLLLP